MSTNPNNAVGTNAAYGGRTSVNAFNDGLAAYSRGVISGWGCVPSSGLTVTLGGNGSTRDVAVAEDNAGNKTSIDNISGSPISVTLSAAPGANSRIDVIVAYADNPPQGSSNIADNYEACGIIAVRGTAAANPVAPNDSTIRTAITADGASGNTAYYVILATITIVSGTTDLTADNIAAGEFATVSYNNLDLDSAQTTLWTNNSPSSSFGSQSITLSDDLSNYKRIEVIAEIETTDSSYRTTTGMIELGNKYPLQAITAGVPMWRSVNTGTVSSGTSLGIGAANWFSSYNSTSVSSSNNYLIPLQVIGYKY